MPYFLLYRDKHSITISDIVPVRCGIHRRYREQQQYVYSMCGRAVQGKYGLCFVYTMPGVVRYWGINRLNSSVIVSVRCRLYWNYCQWQQYVYSMCGRAVQGKYGLCFVYTMPGVVRYWGINRLNSSDIVSV